MWILPLVGILGSIVGFCFLTLAIASGLYYLSELVEEHTVISKRLLSRLIYGIIVLDLLLCFVDRFPFWLTLFGIVSHVVYLGNMRRFPYVTLTDPLFITSCVLVLINHLVWYRHFSARQKNAYNNMSSYYDTPDDMPTFTEIASYFGICVWLVPFALFVSLSASDNILPYENPAAAAGGDASQKKAQGMAKALVDGVRNAIGQVGIAAGWKKRDDGF
ncbi:Protein SVP26 [Cytospora mali]|uniref:Protein SVP26 n=1 Tax=Cytospora mali TaxID=578113 RepID=A0A194VP92_CYTMA|nr:Protein SVP26 [Valsa mali]